MVIDKNRNIIVTGRASNTNAVSDFATVKYSYDGIPLWTNRYDTSPEGEDAVAYALATDTNGTVFVAGSCGTMGGEFTTIAYSSSGVPLWTNQFGDGEIDGGRVRSIVVASNGNVIVTGYLLRNNEDYATIVYSNAGAPLWTNFFGGEVDEQAFAVTTDSNSNVYVTGTLHDFDGFSDIITVAYSANGIPLWNKTFGRGIDLDDSSSRKEAIAVAGLGQIVVVGNSGATNNADEREYTILKYSTVFPSTAPVNLVATFNSPMVELSWPTSHIGWQLQSQATTTGIGTNWVAHPGSTLTNRVWTVLPSNFDFFFRLVSP